LSGSKASTVLGESEPSSYSLAGAVTINASGAVVTGEQDFNNSFGTTSPQPAGDTITGGTLTWLNAAAGQATLTLNTSNSALGVKGVETLGVQFVNPNHAFIIQFDGTATSSGSMDLQTLPSALNGGYAFTFSELNDRSNELSVFGGIFSVSGTTLSNGLVDSDNAGVVTMGKVFNGTISAPDSFGRGTITGTGIAGAINYYIVTPEAIRIVDVDGADCGMGSAFGQGASAGAFSNKSLGSSVFGIQEIGVAAAGMFTTVPGSGTFQGIADIDDGGAIQYAAIIRGVYSIPSDGYGSLTIAPGDLGNATTLGIYLTDPNLNLIDPNNTTSGLGGALIAELDASIYATGVIVPQTDISTASFAGSYAFGAQAYQENAIGQEFDFAAQGIVSGGVLTGNGLLSDPFHIYGAAAADSGATFSGRVVPDGVNPGRYTISTAGGPLAIATVGGWSTNYYNVVIYQANGGQLFWIDENSMSVFLGTLQQQGALIVIGPPA